MEATVNAMLREWRDLWPGGLKAEEYSKLNLMAHCRHGELGYNKAQCEGCHHEQWYASSCGDRHCPKCLGPRQTQWSQQMCERLPDCPHFHMVFSLPAELWEFFEANYRVAADLFFQAAAETLKTFQANNWKCQGGFLAVLHTWGSRLNWHPHLHVLVSSGGVNKRGKWKQVRGTYSFPLKAMSRVFGAIFLRRLEEVDSRMDVQWPEGLETLEKRRQWRVTLSGRFWNIYSKSTLGNTRAVVRYLARYTSRIAVSNRRIQALDSKNRLVTFNWKDYRCGGIIRQRQMTGKKFLRAFIRHLVPKGLRRVRTYGLLTGPSRRFQNLTGAPQSSIAENLPAIPRPACRHCGATLWRYSHLFSRPRHTTTSCSTQESFSLLSPRASP